MGGILPDNTVEVDLFAPDPQCYLTPSEISGSESVSAGVAEEGE